MKQQVRKHDGCTKLIVSGAYQFDVGGKGGSMFEPHATLVVFEKQPERVFTESEVKKVLEEFAIAGDMGRLQAIIIAKRHGIVLDPA